ncbi:MAG: DUF899 domain-containing protein, partial [Solirubrobacterales bacterium]
MTDQRVVSREEWQRERDELLASEKEHTRLGDDLARRRRELPWVRIDEDYSFETEDGPKTLAELFEGRSQLFVYHFMFGPHYTAGCPTCSAGADTYDGAVAHLNARDVSFTCVSRAPLDRLLAYRERMGWSFPWASSEGSDFNFDFQVSQSDEQAAAMAEGGNFPSAVEMFASMCGTDTAGYLADGPGLSVFALSDGVVYQTYSAYARGLEVMLGFYGLLDRVPKGRDESDDRPFWIR